MTVEETISTASAMTWSLRGRSLSLETRTRVMGILNVTPDSFSDGGRFLAPADAVRAGRRMIDQGADILDIGGESTRPGACEISIREELRRVLPAIEGLREVGDIPLSVDTRHAEVASKAVAAGADIINDVSALRHDPAMAEVAVSTGAGLVLMHMRGRPESMQRHPRYRNVVQEVRDFLAERVEAAIAAGIRKDALVVDPGIGFGKTVEHNVDLLADLDELIGMRRPVLIGVSRKSFLGALTGRGPDERLAAGIAAQAFAVLRGARILRVHDVKETCDALKILDMLRRRRT